MISCDDIAHLNENVKAVLTKPISERIEFIRSPRWIGYTRTKAIINKLEDLLIHPHTHRMPNLLVVGDTNNGKSMIVNRFQKLHSAHDNPSGDSITLPVLIIQAPPTPDESRFYSAILDKMFAPHRITERVDRKQIQVFQVLRRVNLKILIIDEIQHILAGNFTKQKQLLNTIKYIGNELQIPIVGVGIKDAFNALQSDSQLSNRFEPMLLPRWKMDTEYLKLLASFERMLPLWNPSNLIESKLALKILSMSEGTIGEISSIITRAAVEAIRTETECITHKLIDSIGWVLPSDRKYKADISG